MPIQYQAELGILSDPLDWRKLRNLLIAWTGACVDQRLHSGGGVNRYHHPRKQSDLT